MADRPPSRNANSNGSALSSPFVPPLNLPQSSQKQQSRSFVDPRDKYNSHRPEDLEALSHANRRSSQKKKLRVDDTPDKHSSKSRHEIKEERHSRKKSHKKSKKHKKELETVSETPNEF